MPFPKNLMQAHAESVKLRPISIAAIEASQDLTFHARAIERSARMLYVFGHDGDIRSADDRVIRVLGFRAFNDIMTASDLILSGYYQAGVMIARDLLELVFLYDDFTAEPSHVEKWRTLHGKDYEKLFRPVEVRKRLDGRDGYTELKRAETYRMLSDLAGHPSPAGFQMLRRKDGNFHCGAFFEDDHLVACWSELAKIAVQVGGHFQEFFDLTSRDVVFTKAEFLELQNDWMEHFFGKAPFDKAKIAEIYALAAKLPPAKQ